MTEFNFSNVKAREIQTELIGRYPIVELEGVCGDPNKVPTLLGVFAGEKNRKFRAAVNKINATRGNARRQMTDDAILLAVRENARSLFPIHVIRGWENVVDGDEKPVPFSPTACEAFLRALPDWILMKAIEYFSTPENFAGDCIALTQGDIEETAGN